MSGSGIFKFNGFAFNSFKRESIFYLLNLNAYAWKMFWVKSYGIYVKIINKSKIDIIRSKKLVGYSKERFCWEFEISFQNFPRFEETLGKICKNCQLIQELFFLKPPLSSRKNGFPILWFYLMSSYQKLFAPPLNHDLSSFFPRSSRILLSYTGIIKNSCFVSLTFRVR